MILDTAPLDVPTSRAGLADCTAISFVPANAKSSMTAAVCRFRRHRLANSVSDQTSCTALRSAAAELMQH